MKRLRSIATTVRWWLGQSLRQVSSRVGILVAVLTLFPVPSGSSQSLTPWVSIGPAGDALGIIHNRGLGRVRSIQILPVVGDYYVYIGAMGGGLWRARGSVGPAWQSIGENLPNPSVGAFTVHPLLPDDVVVGTGDYNRYQGAGMFHTTDGGQTWNPVSLPCAPSFFFRVHRLPGNLDTLVAATDCGVLRSTTGPNGPWTIRLSGLTTDLVIHPSDPQTQFCSKATSGAGNDGGIYKSIDGGQSWTLITSTGAPANNFGLARIAICRDQPNTLAFVHERGCEITNNGISGVRKSVNGGVSWTDVTGPVQLGQACHVIAITFRPNNPDEILVGANNIWRTTDGGQSWVYSDPITPHQDQTQFYFSALTGDNIMWECNDGGIFQINLVANSYQSWNGTAAGNLSISTIAAMDARGTVRAAGFQDDGAALSGDSGSSWTGYSCCDVYTVAVTDTTAPTFWYIDGVNTLKQPLGGGSQNVGDVTYPLTHTLLADPFSSKVYGVITPPAPSLPILVSRPFSASSPGSWTREGPSLPAGLGYIGGNPLNGQTLYVWESPPGYLTVLAKSGGAWSTVRSSMIAGVIDGSTFQIVTVSASPDWPGEGWAGLVTRIGSCGGQTLLGGQAKILHTRDDWQTWEELSPLPSPAGQVTGIAVTPANSRQLFVSTDVGVYYSQDGGRTWQPFQAGLPASVYCTQLKYVESVSSFANDKLVLATCGRGMYEIELPQRGILYVDQRKSSGGNGTKEHPFNTLTEGLTTTPAGGTMALNGATIYRAGGFTQPMTITAYEFPAQIRP